MLRGERVGLRARVEADIAVLHTALYDDVITRSRVSTRPWTPIPIGPDSPFAHSATEPDIAVFSVVELATDELVGAAILASIDLHNRSAHLGISMLSSFRGRGLGTDAVRVLTRYGFATRGLHRLQLETLEDNAAMIASALRVGYQQEGRTRQSAWVDGVFLDEIIFGLLAAEWTPG